MSLHELIGQLGDLGIGREVLVVHTSFRAVGPVQGGPSGLIEALIEVLGPVRNLCYAVHDRQPALGTVRSGADYPLARSDREKGAEGGRRPTKRPDLSSDRA